MRNDEAPQIQRKPPIQSRAKLTCDAIICAAAHILERDGPTGLTTNHIAQRAGVSIGSVYQYFGNKEEILLALAQRGEAELLSGDALIQCASDEKTSPLRLGLRAYINMLADTPDARATALELMLATRGPEGIAKETDAKFRASGLYKDLSKEEQFVFSRAITGVVQSAVREGFAGLKTRAFEDALVRLARCFVRKSSE